MATVANDIVEDLGNFVGAHRIELAACFESVVYGHASERKIFERMLSFVQEDGRATSRALWADRRSSLNDIGGRAVKIATLLRRQSASAAEEALRG